MLAVESEDQEECAHLCFPGSHRGRDVPLAWTTEKEKIISTKIDNAAPLSQCWLSVRGWGWHYSPQVSDRSLPKPVSPSDSPWGQGRVSAARQCSCAASSSAWDVSERNSKLGSAWCFLACYLFLLEMPYLIHFMISFVDFLPFVFQAEITILWKSWKIRK